MTQTYDTLVELYAYDDWANREVIAWWRQLPQPEADPLRLLSHILRAQAVWLDRLNGGNPQGDIWAPVSESDLETWPERHRQGFNAILRESFARDRSQIIRYRRLNGEPMESALGDILTHVATHGVHHRAQIAAWANAHGHKAPSLDFIVYARLRARA